jgi:hypothetical protein
MSDSQNPYEQGLVLVNGQVMPLATASFPITDAGFVRSETTMSKNIDAGAIGEHRLQCERGGFGDQRMKSE